MFKKTSTTPLVSIITPCYNAELYIAEAIKSVQTQSYQNWEMIVVDDASSDSSCEIITKYINDDNRVRLIKNNKNLGTSNSRNIALKKAKGKYIAFLDSDDLWLPTKLEKQINFMEKENILFSYTAYHAIDEAGKKLGDFFVPIAVNYMLMLKTSLIGTLTMVYNTEVLGKFYFEDIGHEDYAMKLQILKKSPYAKGINEPLAQYRIVAKSLSRNKVRAAKWQWNIYRSIEKLSLFKSIYYFTHYIYYGFIKGTSKNPF